MFSISESLLRSAMQTVREKSVSTEPVAVNGYYDKIFVVLSGEGNLQESHYFSFDGKRYAIGPKRK